MKKRSILALILSVAILVTSIPFIIFAEGEAVASEPDVKSEIPYGADIAGVSAYASSGLTVMTEAQATAAGVPAGYSGHVLSLTGASGVGIILDLRDRNIKVETIESITFRVYCTANVREVRITDDAGSSWISRIVPPATGEWIDITLTKDGQNISKSGGMACFADANGYFKPVNFGFRFTDSATSTVYIDSITLNIIDPDAAKEEIPFCDNAGDLSGYGGTQTPMNSQNASAAGILPGYEGYVMSLCSDASSNSSICIDLRQSVCKGVKISDVESVTFRVYASANTTGIRVKTKPDGNWQVNTPPTAKEQWIDFEVTDMSIFVDDGNGYFSPFVFAFRGTDGTTNNTSYIDSITVKLKETTLDTALGKAEIPYTDEDANLSIYGYSAMTLLDAAKAEKAGVTGIEGNYVMQFADASAQGDTSFMLDLRQTVCEDVKIADVESVRFRVWIPHKMDLRIRSVAGAWNHIQGYTPAEGGGWIEITITDMSTFVDDGNGYFSPFAFTFRNNHNPGSPCVVYFDGVTVTLKEVETEAPETTVEETTAAPEPEVPEKPSYSFEDGMGKNEIPYGETDTVGSYYGYSSFEMMNEAQAIAAGVPVGYSGWVLALGASGAGASIGLDLTNIHTADIERISFRIWCPTGTKQDEGSGGIRISGNTASTWNMMVAPTALNEWIDVVLEKDDFSSFDFDGDGYCDLTNFCLRGATGTAYIDHITVELREPEVPEKPSYSFEDGMGKNEIPYGETDTVGSYYGYSSFEMMNEAQAIAAGVPVGYSGWVLALGASGAGASIGLDLTNIHTADIERISFRIWCPTGTKQDEGSGGIRISGNTASTWNMMVAPTALNEWIDVVLEKDDFSSFDYDGDGYCDPLNFCLRGATDTAYIDHITVELRDPDTEPPVITYNGETVINTCIGRQFKLDISAYDAYYNEDLELEYIWSDGAMVDGELVIGTHTCTARATDKAGNVSEIVLTVNVGEQDTEAPSIGPAPADIYAMAGSQVFIDIPVTDNIDDLVATLTWSDGALDAAGRLCAGEHTLTVTATDLSGNTSEVVIAVHVLATRPTVGDVIQDY